MRANLLTILAFLLSSWGCSSVQTTLDDKTLVGRLDTIMNSSCSSGELESIFGKPYKSLDGSDFYHSDTKYLRDIVVLEKDSKGTVKRLQLWSQMNNGPVWRDVAPYFEGKGLEKVSESAVQIHPMRQLVTLKSKKDQLVIEYDEISGKIQMILWGLCKICP